MGVRISWSTLLPHEESQETYSPGSAPDGGHEAAKLVMAALMGAFGVWATKGCVEESLGKVWGGLFLGHWGQAGRGNPLCLHGVPSHVGLPGVDC